MTDERLNLTSASSALADSLCPARFLRQQGLPETKNPEAVAGTRMHEAYAADSTDGLTDPDERKTVEMALERDEQIIESWSTLVNSNPDTVERWITEKRLWSYSINWMDDAVDLFAVDGKVHSGQPDKCWRCRSLDGVLHILIVDFKSGRDVVEKDSHQLRDLAALVHENILAVETVTVAINQPWAPGKPELIHYTPYDLAAAHSEMQSRVMRSRDAKAPAIPGEVQCKYCRALSTCPEANSQLIPAPVVAVEGKLKRGQAQAIARKLTLEDQAAIFKKWGIADKVFKAIEAELKLTAPEALATVGLGFKDGTGRRSITNTVELWNRLAKLGVTQQQFLACVKVGLGDVTEVVQNVTGIKAAKELEAKMDELLEGIVDKKETAKSLVEIKEGE